MLDIEEAYFLKDKLFRDRPATHGPLRIQSHLQRAIDETRSLVMSRPVVQQVKRILGSNPPPFVPMSNEMDEEVRSVRGLWTDAAKRWMLAQERAAAATKE